MKLKAVSIKIFVMITVWVLSLMADVTVSIQQTDYGPQIFVNNETVRPRMFWGADRGGNVELTTEWTDIDFDITAPIDANATWHFRFGQSAGEVWLKDVKIKNAATNRIVFPNYTFVKETSFNNKWNVYPPDEGNTVGQIEFVDSCFHLILSDPPDGDWPDFHIYSDYVTIPEGDTYNFSCKARASSERNLTPAIYHVNNGWTCIGGPDSYFEEQIEMAAAAGIDFITFNISTCWNSDETGEDWLPMDILCQHVLDINPNALLIPRVSMNAPDWWLEENPDALMVFESGTEGTMASVSHQQYRLDAAAQLEKICSHLVESFPENFAGIHPSGQNTGEWFYQKTWGSELSGYDDATWEAWQEYPGGGGDVPTADSRRVANERLVLEPSLDQAVITFNHFLQDEMAEFIIELSEAARRGLGNDKLVLFFYGYHYELAAPWNGPAVSGHYALEKILAAPEIDIITGPISYYDRGLGGSGPNMTSVESILKAGKLWLNEDDTRTYLNTNLEDHSSYGGLSTQEETQAVLLRNLGQSIIRGYGSWWMDHGASTSGGWFADEELWKVLDWAEPMELDMMSGTSYNPRIALIINENSLLHIAGGSTTLGRQLIYCSRPYLAKSGTSFGQYFIDENFEEITADLKIYLATWALDEEEFNLLSQNRNPEETRVWVYGPGYIVENTADMDFMKELTGFEFEKISINNAMAYPTSDGQELGLNSSWGYESDINPLFSVKGDSCQVLAEYENGKPAVAVKESADGIDIFIGIPMLSDELIKTLVKIADLRTITENDVLLWNSEDYTVLHGSEDETINLVFDADVNSIEDAITEETLSSTNHLTLFMASGDTRILKLSTGAGKILNETSLSEFSLSQNYPNPFNPVTMFDYTILEKTQVEIAIYNILGERVEQILDQEKNVGQYTETWNGNDFPSGIYFLQLKTAQFQSICKMLLVK